METASLTREQVRAADRLAIADGIPGIQLMESAGAGVVRLIGQLNLVGPFVVVCGKGNNGGDGFVIARRLLEAGQSAIVVLVCDPAEIHGDAKIAFQLLLARTPTILRSLSALTMPFGCIVDALLGTGARGSAEGEYAKAIEWMNSSGKPIVAVDLPSGLDCDTGLPTGPVVRATCTATFVARKIGFDTPQALEFTGPVHVIDIGIPHTLIREAATLAINESGKPSI